MPRRPSVTPLRSLPWPEELLHGTSTKGLARLRRSRSATALFLTDDDFTAYEYAISSARRDGTEPVIVEFSPRVLRAAGGHLRADYNEDGEVIIEHLIYSGPLPREAIIRVEPVEEE